MKTRGIVATALVGALVLGGGAAAALAGGGLGGDDPQPTPSASAVGEVVAEETAAPLPAASASAADETGAGGDEAAYLDAVREALYRWPGTQIPDASDEELLTAASAACDQIGEGATTDDVRVIDGETENTLGIYQDSAIIGEAAIVYVCD